LTIANCLPSIYAPPHRLPALAIFLYCYATVHWILFLNLVPSGPPLNVAVNSRTSDSLGISWKAPDKHLWNGKLTGYQVCYSSGIGGNQNCLHTESSGLSLNIPNLQPSTKYFVTVAASTKIGYGNRSLVISKITNGGKVYNHIALIASLIKFRLTGLPLHN
jgi:hypothetical protein